jgi:RES domain-containing protein
VTILVHSDQQASYVEAGTELFRLVDPTFASRDTLLNGKGALYREGRYHRAEPTSYVADNVLLCMAEALSYMAYHASEVVSKNPIPLQWDANANEVRTLVVFAVHQIDKLVYVDSMEAREEHRLSRVTILRPDRLYTHLQAVSGKIRADRNGIVYPSARHSENLNVALFNDQTDSLNTICASLQTTLSLIHEKTLKAADTKKGFDPFHMSIHHTKGHYSIDAQDFAASQHKLIPSNMPREGYIDFVRCLYANYPNDAVTAGPLRP